MTCCSSSRHQQPAALYGGDSPEACAPPKEHLDSTKAPCADIGVNHGRGLNGVPENTITSMSKYPGGVPSKFTPSGQVQSFPGNSVLCHLPASCPLLPGLQSLHENLYRHPLRHIFAILPPSSWHMTVINGICGAVRKPGSWPGGMMDQTLDTCTAEFSASLGELGASLEGDNLGPPYHIRVVKFKFLHIGIGIHVMGATPSEEARLRRLRDKLADAMGFRHADHYRYEFHVTMAYLLRHLTSTEEAELSSWLNNHLHEFEKEFVLGATEFCTFPDMCSFRRLFYLGDVGD